MSKDDTTWLNVAYVIFGVLLAYVTYKAIETVGIQSGWSDRYGWYSMVETFGSIVIGALSTWYLRSDKERHEYFLSSISELRKVTWPTWEDTKRMTIVVCIVVAVFAVILGVFDVIWSKALNLLLT